METLVVPAVIAKDQEELDRTLGRIEGHTDRVQLDFMDGRFVSNTSMDFDFRVPSGITYEAHLMVEDPLEWVDRIADRIDIAIMHVRTLEDIPGAIGHVRAKGLGAALAVNPGTPVDTVIPYLDRVEFVLVMTVEPGSYCVDFREDTLEKVRALRQADPAIPIEVDGCENPPNAKKARAAGANIFASGSFIHQSDDPGKAIEELYEAVGGYSQ